MPRHRRGWAFSHTGVGEDRLTPLLGALIEPALLILLQEKPQHGYTLLENLSSLGLTTPHPSVIYRTLRDMEILHWIQSQWDAADTQGPPRRIYSLTNQGEAALLNWLNEFEKANDLINKLSGRIRKEK